MADGRVEPTTSVRNQPLWTELFRGFQVALDPRKLLVAAVGILATALGWYFLSAIFYAPTMPERTAEKYNEAAMKKELGEKKSDDTTYSEQEYRAKGDELYSRDLAQWNTQHALAGPGGKIRSMPWHEFRGENPFLLATNLVEKPSLGRVIDYITAQVPYMIEPLGKLLLPVIKLLDPNASFLTRVYLLLCLLWSVGVWAFFGGIITRLAAVQFGGKESITVRQAVQFVTARYTSYLLSPLVPLAIIAVIVVGMSLYGFVALIPILGDVVLYGLGLPLVILGGIVMAILLIGMIGYPLMYTTISTEGSDTFDALSRAYNYVFQAPWQYLWYGLVSVVYGAAVTFVVIVLGCLMVYLGKWAVSQPASAIATERKPDFLFIYSPESYGWRELLLKGSPVEIKPTIPTDLKPLPNEKGSPLEPFSEVKLLTEKETSAAASVKSAAERLEKAGEADKNVAAGAKLAADKVLADAKAALAEAKKDEESGYNAFRNKVAGKQYMKEMAWYNYAGAGLVTLWMVLVFLVMIGFSYSYFWSASTMIYLLMRKKVDEVEIDEVYIEDVADAPVAPPSITPPAPSLPSAAATAPVIPPSTPPVVTPSVPPTEPPPAS